MILNVSETNERRSARRLLRGVMLGLLVVAGVGVGPSPRATAASPSPSAGQRGDLTVEVTGLRNADGNVRIALCHTLHCYEEQEGFLRETVVKADLPSVKVTFGGLPPGEYTVMMFHDEDADGKFDRSFLGLPQEGFGFSRDGRPVFSEPAYDRVVLRIGPAGLHTRITVQYW